MAKIKKIFSPEAARKVIEIFLKTVTVFVILLLVYAVVGEIFGGFGEADGEGLTVIGGILLAFYEPARHWGKVLEMSVHNNLAIVVFLCFAAAMIIKLIDYRLSTGDKAKTAKNKVFNILGIIALPLWIVYLGTALWFLADFLSRLFSDISVLHIMITVLAYTVIIAVPTLCIFIYSLILDIAGLRSKSMAEQN